MATGAAPLAPAGASSTRPDDAPAAPLTPRTPKSGGIACSEVVGIIVVGLAGVVALVLGLVVLSSLNLDQGTGGGFIAGITVILLGIALLYCGEKALKRARTLSLGADVLCAIGVLAVNGGVHAIIIVAGAGTGGDDEWMAPVGVAISFFLGTAAYFYLTRRIVALQTRVHASATGSADAGAAAAVSATTSAEQSSTTSGAARGDDTSRSGIPGGLFTWWVVVTTPLLLGWVGTAVWSGSGTIVSANLLLQVLALFLAWVANRGVLVVGAATMACIWTVVLSFVEDHEKTLLMFAVLLLVVAAATAVLAWASTKVLGSPNPRAGAGGVADSRADADARGAGAAAATSAGQTASSAMAHADRDGDFVARTAGVSFRAQERAQVRETLAWASLTSDVLGLFTLAFIAAARFNGSDVVALTDAHDVILEGALADVLWLCLIPMSLVTLATGVMPHSGTILAAGLVFAPTGAESAGALWMWPVGTTLLAAHIVVASRRRNTVEEGRRQHQHHVAHGALTSHAGGSSSRTRPPGPPWYTQLCGSSVAYTSGGAVVVTTTLVWYVFAIVHIVVNDPASASDDDTPFVAATLLSPTLLGALWACLEPPGSRVRNGALAACLVTTMGACSVVALTFPTVAVVYGCCAMATVAIVSATQVYAWCHLRSQATSGARVRHPVVHHVDVDSAHEAEVKEDDGAAGTVAASAVSDDVATARALRGVAGADVPLLDPRVHINLHQTVALLAVALLAVATEVSGDVWDSLDIGSTASGGQGFPGALLLVSIVMYVLAWRPPPDGRIVVSFPGAQRDRSDCWCSTACCDVAARIPNAMAHHHMVRPGLVVPVLVAAIAGFLGDQVYMGSNAAVAAISFVPVCMVLFDFAAICRLHATSSVSPGRTASAVWLVVFSIAPYNAAVMVAYDVADSALADSHPEGAAITMTAIGLASIVAIAALVSLATATNPRALVHQVPGLVALALLDTSGSVLMLVPSFVILTVALIVALNVRPVWAVVMGPVWLVRNLIGSARDPPTWYGVDATSDWKNTVTVINGAGLVLMALIGFVSQYDYFAAASRGASASDRDGDGELSDGASGDETLGTVDVGGAHAPAKTPASTTHVSVELGVAVSTGAGAPEGAHEPMSRAVTTFMTLWRWVQFLFGAALLSLSAGGFGVPIALGVMYALLGLPVRRLRRRLPEALHMAPVLTFAAIMVLVVHHAKGESTVKPAGMVVSIAAIGASAVALALSLALFASDAFARYCIADRLATCRSPTSRGSLTVSVFTWTLVFALLSGRASQVYQLTILGLVMVVALAGFLPSAAVAAVLRPLGVYNWLTRHAAARRGMLTPTSSRFMAVSAAPLALVQRVLALAMGEHDEQLDSDPQNTAASGGSWLFFGDHGLFGAALLVPAFAYIVADATARWARQGTIKDGSSNGVMDMVLALAWAFFIAAALLLGPPTAGIAPAVLFTLMMVATCSKHLAVSGFTSSYWLAYPLLMFASITMMVSDGVGRPAMVHESPASVGAVVAACCSLLQSASWAIGLPMATAGAVPSSQRRQRGKHGSGTALTAAAAVTSLTRRHSGSSDGSLGHTTVELAAVPARRAGYGAGAAEVKAGAARDASPPRSSSAQQQAAIAAPFPELTAPGRTDLVEALLFVQVAFGLGGGPATNGIAPVVVGFLFTVRPAYSLFRSKRALAAWAIEGADAGGQTRAVCDACLFTLAPIMHCIAFAVGEPTDDDGFREADQAMDGLTAWGVISLLLEVRSMRRSGTSSGADSQGAAGRDKRPAPEHGPLVRRWSAIVARAVSIGVTLVGVFFRAADTDGWLSLLTTLMGMLLILAGVAWGNVAAVSFFPDVVVYGPATVWAAVATFAREHREDDGAERSEHVSDGAAAALWVSMLLLAMLLPKGTALIRSRTPAWWFASNAEMLSFAAVVWCSVTLAMARGGAGDAGFATFVYVLLPLAAHTWQWRTLILLMPLIWGIMSMFFTLVLDNDSAVSAHVSVGLGMGAWVVLVLLALPLRKRHNWGWGTWEWHPSRPGGKKLLTTRGAAQAGAAAGSDELAGIVAGGAPDRGDVFVSCSTHCGEAVCCRRMRLNPFNTAIEITTVAFLVIAAFMALWWGGVVAESSALQFAFVGSVAVVALALLVLGFASDVPWRRFVGMMLLTASVFFAAGSSEQGLASALLLLVAAVFALATVALYVVWWRALNQQRAQVRGASTGAAPAVTETSEGAARARPSPTHPPEAEAKRAPATTTAAQAADPRAVPPGTELAECTFCHGQQLVPTGARMVGCALCRMNFAPIPIYNVAESGSGSGGGSAASASATISAGSKAPGAHAGGETKPGHVDAPAGMVVAVCPRCAGRQLVPEDAPLVRCALCSVPFEPRREDAGAPGASDARRSTAADTDAGASATRGDADVGIDSDADNDSDDSADDVRDAGGDGVVAQGAAPVDAKPAEAPLPLKGIPWLNAVATTLPTHPGTTVFQAPATSVQWCIRGAGSDDGDDGDAGAEGVVIDMPGLGCAVLVPAEVLRGVMNAQRTDDGK